MRNWWTWFSHSDNEDREEGTKFETLIRQPERAISLWHWIQVFECFVWRVLRIKYKGPIVNMSAVSTWCKEKLLEENSVLVSLINMSCMSLSSSRYTDFQRAHPIPCWWYFVWNRLTWKIDLAGDWPRICQFQLCLVCHFFPALHLFVPKWDQVLPFSGQNSKCWC